MSIQSRKDDHIDLCLQSDVGFHTKSTLLEEVELIHQSLPELSVDEIDISTTVCGKSLAAPFIIAAMTGGIARAAEINLALAQVAERNGYGFGLGSQRAMQKEPEVTWTYQVRQVAPQALLLGNIGVVQARKTGVEGLRGLVKAVGADAMCLHMNPAMELIQPEGDRDFRGCLDTMALMVKELGVPIVAKETGNGISAQTAGKLAQVGIRHVDVSGAGGTSWVAVETHRADSEHRAFGQLMRDWGVPTAVSVAHVVSRGMHAIATGGIRTTLDVAKAIALGADAVGIARPVLQAWDHGGQAEVQRWFATLERDLRSIMLLCGAQNIKALQHSPKLLGSRLKMWLS